MPIKKRPKVQIEQDRQEKDRAKQAELARKKREAELRAEMRKQQSRPRVELPSQYAGESIFVHKKIYEGFMKNKKISILSCRVEGGSGGRLILDYATQAGGQGRLELVDLGPMPVKGDAT